MTLQRFANRLTRRYGTQITNLVGGNLSGVQFQFGDTGGNAATAGGGMVTIGRDWWRGASGIERKGALVHELAHLAAPNHESHGDRWKTMYVRAAAEALDMDEDDFDIEVPYMDMDQQVIDMTAAWLEGR